MSRQPPSPLLARLVYESILIEWTDTNRRNATFEGTAREIMRVQLNHRIHPMGEVVFHPAARRGDPEWRVMYIGHGDGGAGEMRTMARPNPQRLDTWSARFCASFPTPPSMLTPAHSARTAVTVFPTTIRSR